MAQTRDSSGGRSAVIARLPVGYFSLVMATGIVSTGLKLVGQTLLSQVLLAIAICCFIALLIMNVWRFIGFRPQLAAEARNPQHMFELFTLVAASAVLAAGIAAPTGIELGVAVALAALAAAIWIWLAYRIPTWLLISDGAAQPMLRNLDGTWFLAAVGTQSVVVAAATLEGLQTAAAEVVAAVALMFWSLGLMAYLLVAALTAARLLLFSVVLADLRPAYWIASGAASITVVAGTRLLTLSGNAALGAVRPAVLAASIALWALALWLVPLIAAVTFRRYVRDREPVRYEPQMWAVSFPLGMFAVASIELGQAAKWPIVEEIGRWWVWLALAVWVLIGLLALVPRAAATTR